jgi:hypothetical protein
LAGAADGQRVGGKLLAKADGDRILHVRPTRLEDPVKGARTVVEGRRQLVERDQDLLGSLQRGDTHGGREDIVGRLGHVDVVVGVDGLVRPTLAVANALCAQDLAARLASTSLVFMLWLTPAPAWKGSTRKLSISSACSARPASVLEEPPGRGSRRRPG